MRGDCYEGFHYMRIDYIREVHMQRSNPRVLPAKIKVSLLLATVVSSIKGVMSLPPMLAVENACASSGGQITCLIPTAMM